MLSTLPPAPRHRAIDLHASRCPVSGVRPASALHLRREELEREASDVAVRVHDRAGPVLSDAHLRAHPEGGVVVSGSPETICGVRSTRTWRIDESGHTMWDALYNDHVCTSTRPVELDVAPDGRVAVVSGRPNNFSGFLILMYDAQGNLLWERELEIIGAGATPSAVRFDADGGIVVVGMWQEIPSLDAYGIVRLDQAGTPTWGWFPGAAVNIGAGLWIDFDAAGRVVTVSRGSGRATVILFDPTCLPDIDGDGIVGFGDVVAVLASWGPCASCPADIDGDGSVGFGDVVAVLASWGPCP